MLRLIFWLQNIITFVVSCLGLSFFNVNPGTWNIINIYRGCLFQADIVPNTCTYWLYINAECTSVCLDQALTISSLSFGISRDLWLTEDKHYAYMTDWLIHCHCSTVIIEVSWSAGFGKRAVLKVSRLVRNLVKIGILFYIIKALVKRCNILILDFNERHLSLKMRNKLGLIGGLHFNLFLDCHGHDLA